MVYYEDLLTYYMERWYNTSTNYTLTLRGNQRHNSKALKQLKSNFYQWFNDHGNVTTLEDDHSQMALKKMIIPFMDNTLGVETWVCEQLDKEGYYEATTVFVTKVKSDFPNMTFENIFQALRNVWVLISLQLYMNNAVVMTDAIYAYSMLYPLTDNYLDDPSISTGNKRAFNQRFYEHIKNGQVEPLNQGEEDIFHMIDLIHHQYDRIHYPEVTNSLLAILDAQNKSLNQQHMATIFDIDLVQLTFYKGGSSVLADAYIVKGHLTDNEAKFAYGYGLILQIADDLQDLVTDTEEGSATMTNTQAFHSTLDGLIKKYLLFIDEFFLEIYDTTTERQRALKQLLLASIELLLFGAITQQKKYFSKDFYRDFTKKSRFSKKSFNFMNNRLWHLIEERL